jgi:predicted acylesterase/phospholipase RssA
MTKLRLGLTISGAVSLGAYEGGALAALLYAVRPLAGGDDPEVRIDAIGGASAGAMTALIAGRALLEGLDPAAVMQSAWVKNDSLTDLQAHSTDGPLSIQSVRQLSSELLKPSASPSALRQSRDIRLVIVAACLRGLEYNLPALNADQQVRASTFVDLMTDTLTQGQSVESLTTPAGRCLLDIVLASGANAIGFPPLLLDRSQDEKAYVEGAHVTNFPASKQLWYTDGGTLDNEPLGHTFDLTNEIDQDGAGDFSRVHLLIHPHPTAAPTDDAWADPDREPTWSETFLRAQNLQRTQSLYADLKQVEKTNSRIAWTGALVDGLGAALDRLEGEGAAVVRAALSQIIGRIDGDKKALKAGRSDAAAVGAPAISDDAGDDLTALLDRAVRAAAGVGGKRASSVEVISPLVLPDAKDHPVEQMLAGEFLFHFGGFLDEKLRQSDFDLGYSSTQTWLKDGGLSRHGLSADDNKTALDAVASAYQPGDTWKQYGTATLGSLSALDKLQAGRLAAHVNHVLIHDLLAGKSQN